MKVQWIKTTKEVFDGLYSAFYRELIPFATYTDPDGTCHLGNGERQIMTEWGFKGADAPLMKEHLSHGETSFYIASIREEVE